MMFNIQLNRKFSQIRQIYQFWALLHEKEDVFLYPEFKLNFQFDFSLEYFGSIWNDMHIEYAVIIILCKLLHCSIL